MATCPQWRPGAHQRRTSTPSTTLCAASATCRGRYHAPGADGLRSRALQRQVRLPPDYSEDGSNRRMQTTLAQLGLKQWPPADRQAGGKISGGSALRQHRDGLVTVGPVPRRADLGSGRRRHQRWSAAREPGEGHGQDHLTIHQPAKDSTFNLRWCSAGSGIPIYYGPTRTATASSVAIWAFDKTERRRQPRDMFDMLNQRERPIWEACGRRTYSPRFAARQAAGREWNAEFFNPRTPSSRRCTRGHGRRRGRSPAGFRVRGDAGASSSCSSAATSRPRFATSAAPSSCWRKLDHRILLARVRRTEGGDSLLVLGCVAGLGRRSVNSAPARTLCCPACRSTDHSGAAFFLVVAAVVRHQQRRPRDRQRACDLCASAW